MWAGTTDVMATRFVSFVSKYIIYAIVNQDAVESLALL